MPKKDKAVYKRVVLKLTGESLQGRKGYGIDLKVARSVAQEIKEVKEIGVDLACVIRSEEHTSELQSLAYLVFPLLL